MEETNVRNVMILLAVATPIVALLLGLVGQWTESQAGEPMPGRMRRNLWVLAAAGPANLILWFLFNGLLAGVGSRSVIGYVLAALAFVGGGFATGFFSRLRQRPDAVEQERGDDGE